MAAPEVFAHGRGIDQERIRLTPAVMVFACAGGAALFVDPQRRPSRWDALLTSPGVPRKDAPTVAPTEIPMPISAAMPPTCEPELTFQDWLPGLLPLLATWAGVAALPWIDPASTHEYWQLYAPFYAILLLILLFPALYVVIVFLCLMHVVYAAVRDELRIRREERRYRCAVLS